MTVRTYRWAGSLALVAVLCSHATAQTSSFRILDSHAFAMQARIDLIQRAEHTIDLAYYGVDTGEVPTAILELLRQAAGRGVRVRVIVDSYRSKLPSGLSRYLHRSGVQIHEYHRPGRLHPAWMNQRIHSKLLVADGTVAVVGSRNLENGHFGIDDHVNFADCDALIAGRAAYQTQVYFDWLWQLPDVEPAQLDRRIEIRLPKLRLGRRSEWDQAWQRAKTPRDYQCLLSQSVGHVGRRLGVTVNSPCDLLEGAAHGIEVSLLNDCRPDKSNRRFQREVIRLMDGACRSITIETPYPAFHKQVRASISRARSRGVCVTILTNSIATTNVLSVYAAYQNQKRSLLREGVHLREYCGSDTLHAKTMLVDQTIWMLGSYNFDSRSDNANLETAIVSNSPVGAGLLARDMQKRISRSTRIDPGKWLLEVGSRPSLTKRTKMILERSIVEAYRGLL